MGKCKYCGQNAGFLKYKHQECERKYFNGKTQIIDLIENAIVNTGDFKNLKNEIVEIAKENFIKSIEIDSLFTNGFDNAVDKFLEDGLLSAEEEDKIANFQNQLNLGQEILDKNNSLQKVIKASIIREISEGKIPDLKLQIEGQIPFNFQKNESLIWLFQNVQFYEQRTKTQYQGGYSGVSLRVTKGVYYRTGGFRGKPVKVEEMTFIGTGIFAITNKHIYFASTTKSLRIQLGKIITINPYEDGIGIQKEGVTAKPQIFKNIDGWFIYNLITNITQ